MNMKLDIRLRSFLVLSLWAVSHITYAICTDLPSYDPQKKKITIPCLQVLKSPVEIYALDLNERADNAYVYDLDPATLKAKKDYKKGDTGPRGGIVFIVDASGHGVEAKMQDVSGQHTFENAFTVVHSYYGFDWRLPSREELNILAQNQDIVGGFGNGFYWSSNTHGGGEAWITYFKSQGPKGHNVGFKNTSDRGAVRAVASF